MTGRESVIWFDLHEDEQSLKQKVAERFVNVSCS
jgi:hypothetical protein